MCDTSSLRAALAELGRANGYKVLACATPLDVIQTLLQLGDRIRHAIISSEPRWGLGLPEFLSDEYPDIERIMLAA